MDFGPNGSGQLAEVRQYAAMDALLEPATKDPTGASGAFHLSVGGCPVSTHIDHLFWLGAHMDCLQAA